MRLTYEHTVSGAGSAPGTAFFPIFLIDAPGAIAAERAARAFARTGPGESL